MTKIKKAKKKILKKNWVSVTNYTSIIDKINFFKKKLYIYTHTYTFNMKRNNYFFKHFKLYMKKKKLFNIYIFFF